MNVCSNGCYLFPQHDKNFLICPNVNCQRPRYIQHNEAVEARNSGVDLNVESVSSFAPVQHLSVASVSASLAQLLVNNEKRQSFQHRHLLGSFDEEEPVYRDVFDGEVFEISCKINICSVMKMILPY